MNEKFDKKECERHTQRKNIYKKQSTAESVAKIVGKRHNKILKALFCEHCNNYHFKEIGVWK